jgi:hypothetical protein
MPGWYGLLLRLLARGPCCSGPSARAPVLSSALKWARPAWHCKLHAASAALFTACFNYMLRWTSAHQQPAGEIAPTGIPRYTSACAR